MSIDEACGALVQDFRSRPTIRAGSLITTVFGDSIAPRGGTVWLGSLIHALDNFGVNERLVRTSVFRLAKDGWLQSEQHGRRSYYSLTDDGRARFQSATHRIYSPPAEAWDGEWTLILLPNLNAVTRDLVKRECGWLGFGAITTNVIAHPAPNIDDTQAALERLGVAEEVVVISGQTLGDDDAMRRLARDSWNLVELAERYMAFAEQFEPARTAFRENGEVDSRTGFIIRTLLIQEYRKVLLRDPQMPQELLPPRWPGHAAYELCRELYIATSEACDQYLDDVMETVDGKLPPPGDAYLQRFGGKE